MDLIKWIYAWIVKKVSNHGWKWIGGELPESNEYVQPRLFEKHFTHMEFDVRAELGIDMESNRGAQFSDVWKPGAVLLPPKWTEQIGQDIQWYVPRFNYHMGCQTGGGIREFQASGHRILNDMETDTEIFIGERSVYYISLKVFYQEDLVASSVRNNLDLQFEVQSMNMDAIDKILEPMLLNAVSTARMEMNHHSSSFSAA